MSTPTPDIDIDRSKGDFHFAEDYAFDAGTGLRQDTIDYISNAKGEDEWVREFRKKALKIFEDKPMPTSWATKDLENIVFEELPEVLVVEPRELGMMEKLSKFRPDTANKMMTHEKEMHKL